MRIQDEVIALVQRNLEEQGMRMPPGAAEEQIDAFEKRLGLRVPAELREWLRLCSGARTSPGALYGICPDESGLDIEWELSVHPEWRDHGWIPVGGDGFGDTYLLDTTYEIEGSHPIYFSQHEGEERIADYVVASGLWTFIRFELLVWEIDCSIDEDLESGELTPARELDWSDPAALEEFHYWPLNKKRVLEEDPLLAKYKGKVPFLWDLEDFGR